MRLGVALLVLVAVTTLAAALGAEAAGALTPLVSVSGLVLGLVAGGCVLRSVEVPEAETAGPGAWDLAAGALFGIVALKQFAWLLFNDGGVMRTANAYNYGDLPLHITYIEFFARGAHFWPANPIFTGEPLRYPIGMDLWNAVLLQLGVPVAFGLKATGLIASLLLGVALWRWGGALGLLAFTLSGGVEIGGLSWLNLFLSLFVTQRGFLFALPAGLVLLHSWRARILRRSGPGLPPWVEGLLWGALPLFHLHSFLFVSVILGLWTIARGGWPGTLRAFGVAVLPATLGVLAVTDGLRAASLVGWAPGWVIGDRSVALFLAKNFGLLLPLAVALGVFGLKRRIPEWRLCVLPSLAIWLGLFFVKLAPWAWDNTKVMVWCFVLLLPALGDLMSRFSISLRSLILVAWLAPGAVTVAGATLVLRHDLDVYDIGERSTVCRIVARLPPDVRVAARPTFNHPAALCGQAVVEGYAGHLWSHGIDAGRVDADLHRLMLGEPGWRAAAKRLQARYLYWGRAERAEFPGSSQAWAEAPPLAEGDWGRLYALAD
jgi:hypothetical protein